MLKRVMTGLAVALVMLLAILKLSSAWFGLFSGLLVLWAQWEWLSFSPKINPYFKTGCLIAMAGLLGLIQLGIWPISSDLFLLGIGFWVIAILLILFPMDWSEFLKHPLSLVVSSFVFLLPAGVAVVYLQEGARHWALIYLILITALADTGAYFSGKFFGKHLMAPKVSPKKTLEGALGGLILASLLPSLFYEWIGKSGRADFFEILLISMGLVLISIFGDLFESLLKRHCGVKDSGVLLPGHGGILDRIDSVIAVLPIFAWIEMTGRFFS